MFDFLRRSDVRKPSDALRHALEASDLPDGIEIATLGVVESRGSYAGRGVTYFRVFDQTRAAVEYADVFRKHLFTGHAYDNLNAHPQLVLRDGFREQDGAVVVHQH
jgi:hypothetical protein